MTNDQITLKILSERIQRRRDAGDHEADAMAFVAGELSEMLARAVDIAMSDDPKAAQYYLIEQLKKSPPTPPAEAQGSRMGYGGN
jgi:hypothetical protein